jgi:hypothetical protein
MWQKFFCLSAQDFIFALKVSKNDRQFYNAFSVSNSRVPSSLPQVLMIIAAGRQRELTTSIIALI